MVHRCHLRVAYHSIGDGQHHTGLVARYFFWLFSFLGVPDHKGGVVMLLVGILLSLAQGNSQRKLAVDLGGTI